MNEGREEMSKTHIGFADEKNTAGNETTSDFGKESEGGDGEAS